MGPVQRIRRHLTYANLMSSLAVFVALGGGAYALSVPQNSVGARELKRGAVTGAKLRRGAVTTRKVRAGAITSAQVRDRSLRASDLAPGAIAVLGGARAGDTDPVATPGAQLKSAGFNLSSAGKAFVLGTLAGPFLTCGTDPCQADWGVYVDGQPVPDTGLHLEATGLGGDGFEFYTLFGVTPTLHAGSHTVTLNRTGSGAASSVGELGSQLGAVALGA